MEVKVSVDGVPRVVCGVTDKTTCQEVVIALAQALGRTGRYTLKEKFKDFERNVSPDEHLLESLGKYGQHGREVRLTLLRTGPSQGGGAGEAGAGVGPGATRRGSQQPCAALRRGDVGGRGGGGRRGGGGGGGGSRRQSLPPLSRLLLRAEAASAASQAAEEKKAKRKSLTLVEEAFGWLESLGRGGKLLRRRKRKEEEEEETEGREPDKRKGRTPSSSDDSPAASQDCWPPGGVCGTGCHQQRAPVAVRQSRTSFLEEDGVGEQDDNGNHGEEAKKDGDPGRRRQEVDTLEAKADRKTVPQPARKASVSPLPPPLPLRTDEVEEEKLRALLTHQQTRLHALQLQLDSTDAQIRDLEAQQRPLEETEGEPEEKEEEEEEEEELAFWENELRAEEGYERDLQAQFMEMKRKAADCKAMLEEYRGRLEGRDLTQGARASVPEADPPAQPGREVTATAAAPKAAVPPSRTRPHAGTLLRSSTRPDGDLQRTRPSTPDQVVAEKTVAQVVAKKTVAQVVTEKTVAQVVAEKTVAQVVAEEKTPAPAAPSCGSRVQVPPPHQTTADPQGRGTGQLRERWAGSSDGQNQSVATEPAALFLHRSEITIHLSSTRV